MMEIRRTDSLGGPGGPGRVEGSRPTPAPPGAGGGAPAGHPDRVEISNIARLLGAVNNLPPVRQEKVDQLRAEIASGRYETPEKIERMVERLLEDLGEGPDEK